MLFSIFDVLRIFEALQIFFYRFLLKWGKIEEDFESSIFLETQKYCSAFASRLNFFSNGHIRNVVSTLSNVVKINVENDNVVQFNVEIHNVVSTLLNIVNLNVDVHNVVLTLTSRCATSRRHINLKTTLKRRLNICWVKFADVIIVTVMIYYIRMRVAAKSRVLMLRNFLIIPHKKVPKGCTGIALLQGFI